LTSVNHVENRKPKSESRKPLRVSIFAFRFSALPHWGAAMVEESKKNSSKLNEQCGNLYENKGSLWKTLGQSWNVYENKGT
jgi:hypothetical protein